MFGESRVYGKEGYRDKRRFRRLVFAFAAIVCLLTALYSLQVNQYGLKLGEIFRIISEGLGGATYSPYDDYRGFIENHMVFDMYVPRAVGCVTIGAILAMGGAVMQSAIRNPLADSYTTGISSGAMLGVTVFVVLGLSLVPISGETGKIINAFAFSLIPCTVIIAFSIFRKTTPAMIVLIGVATSFLFSAIVTLLNYTAAPDQLEEVYKWGIGTMNMINPASMKFLVPISIAMLAILTCMAKIINIVSVGDNFAKSVGVKSNRVRISLLVLVSLFTSVAVCFVGTIGFVGLVVPHISRMFVGSDNKVLIPMSAVMGAMVLLLADCVARSLVPGGLPVGFITSIIGGPVLLFLLLKMRKNAWGG